MATSTNRAGRRCFTWNTRHRPANDGAGWVRRHRLLAVNRRAFDDGQPDVGRELCQSRGTAVPTTLRSGGIRWTDSCAGAPGWCNRSNGAVLLLAERGRGVGCARRDLASVLAERSSCQLASTGALRSSGFTHWR